MKYCRYNQHSLKFEKSSEIKSNASYKKRRTTAFQTHVLQSVYQKTAFPSTQQREDLAQKLDMSPRAVQVWFQNKRQAARKAYST